LFFANVSNLSKNTRKIKINVLSERADVDSAAEAGSEGNFVVFAILNIYTK
jgi:hypothetical protein